VANVLTEFSKAEKENRSAGDYCERLGKDRHDALLLLDVAVRRGITGLASRKTVNHHWRAIEEEITIVAEVNKFVPRLVPKQEISGISQMAYAVNQWLVELNGK
jgi:glycine cleavage system protein P-like pyridoxal-binding family